MMPEVARALRRSATGCFGIAGTGRLKLRLAIDPVSNEAVDMGNYIRHPFRPIGAVHHSEVVDPLPLRGGRKTASAFVMQVDIARHNRSDGFCPLGPPLQPRNWAPRDYG